MTDFGPLFEYTPVRGPDVCQPRELKRVVGRLGSTVLDFLRSKVGKSFHASELHAYVAEHAEAAPGSADRTMRELQKKGLVRYVVESRRESLYRCLGVAQ